MSYEIRSPFFRPLVILKNNIHYFPLTEFFRCLTKVGTVLQANTLTLVKKMRELIFQGGDVLKFEEENRSGKTDIEVIDVFFSYILFNYTVYNLFT